MATKTTTKKTGTKTSGKKTGGALSATMKKVAAEDKTKAAERAAAPDEATVPATPAKAPTTPRAAKGGKKAGKGATKPKTGAPANDGAKAPTQAKPKGKAAKPDAPKRLSAIDAAARVLTASGGEMSAREMVAAMTEKGLWSSPGGKTPDATLYSAIIREIGAKGADARFKKTNRGRFASNGKRD
jgi:hypothetical protein